MSIVSPSLWLGSLLLAGFLVGCASEPSEELEPSPLPEIKTELKLRRDWSTSVGEGVSDRVGAVVLQPAVAAGTVYVASATGEVRAYRLADGERLWRVKLGVPTGAALTVAGDRLLLGTDKGEMLALSAQNGQVQWRSPVAAAVMSLPVVAGERVVVRTGDGHVFGLELATGKQVWSYDSPVPPLSLRGVSAPLVDDDNVYVGDASGRVVALNADTGQPRWDVRAVSNTGRSELERMVDIDAGLLLDGERLYVAGYQSQLVALEVGSGRRLWEQPWNGFRDLVGGLGNVYGVSVDGVITAFDASTGAVAWKQPGLRGRGLSQPAVWNNRLVVADADGWLHVLAQVDGHFLGRIKLRGQPVVAPVTVADSALVALTAEGRLVAVSPR